MRTGKKRFTNTFPLTEYLLLVPKFWEIINHAKQRINFYSFLKWKFLTIWVYVFFVIKMYNLILITLRLYQIQYLEQ